MLYSESLRMWITSPEPVLTRGGPMRVTPSNGTKKRGTPVIGQHRWKRCCAWISIVTLGMFAQSGMAETTTQFVYADDEASARGVVGYVATDFGEGATETLLLGTEFSGTIVAPGIVAATCIQAWDCWQEASRQGCTP